MKLLVLSFALLVTAHGYSCTVVKDTSYYLSLSSVDLFNAATSGNTIGKCRVAQNTGSAGCFLYVKAAIRGTAGDYGWPKRADGHGSGCVRAPHLLKNFRTCYFWNRAYSLTGAERRTFCTNDGMSNAVAQLRHALRHNACGLSAATPSYQDMAVDDLFAAATDGNRVGDCYIQQNGPGGGACDLYVKSAFPGAAADRGWPKTTGGRGTGCVRAPDFPKRVSTCYFDDPRYPLTTAERSSFCTDSGKSNAVAQLKHAIRNNACKLSALSPVECTRGSPGCRCE